MEMRIKFEYDLGKIKEGFFEGYELWKEDEKYRLTLQNAKDSYATYENVVSLKVDKTTVKLDLEEDF